jgi:hypothetical protein
MNSESFRIERRQLREKQVEIGTVVFEHIQNIFRRIAEIDNDMAFVFFFSELLAKKALSDPPRPVYHQCGRPAAPFLPCQQIAIYFSFKRVHGYRLLWPTIYPILTIAYHINHEKSSIK